MTEAIQYQYSYRFSIATMVLMLIMMLLLFVNVVAINNFTAWLIYSFFAAIFLFMETLLVIKRLLPAIYGDIALQVDNQGISDYIRDASINWADIKEISLIGGRSASSIQIILKWESEYGSRLNIPLRWVKGDDNEIYATVNMYFEHYQQPTDQ